MVQGEMNLARVAGHVNRKIVERKISIVLDASDIAPGRRQAERKRTRGIADSGNFHVAVKRYTRLRHARIVLVHHAARDRNCGGVQRNRDHHRRERKTP